VAPPLPRQLGLFGEERLELGADPSQMRHIELGDGAWLDYQQGFLRGHQQLFEQLLRDVRFHAESRQMYERRVAVPRVTAQLPDDGPLPPILLAVQALLTRRYAEPLSRVSLAYYRDGRDSVAWHGDYVSRERDQALVCSVSLGAPRKFLLRKRGGGASRSLQLGWGDLLVMGGTCQRCFEHAVPKVAVAQPRLAILYRST
jgi:alkylated DNA repair dioxygenase AlkB